MGYVIVFVGAGAGGALRHAVNRLAAAIPGGVPWATMIVNMSGCLVMGLLAGWFAFRGHASSDVRLFLTTGLLGGYTTFSAFSLDVVLLWERGDSWGAAMYAGASVVFSIAFLFLGLQLVRIFSTT